MARTSFTPTDAALSCSKWLLVYCAMMLARVVFPRAGRAVENDAHQAVGFEHATQQLAWTQEMLLPDELVDVARGACETASGATR